MVGPTVRSLSSLIFIIGFLRIFTEYIVMTDAQAPPQTHVIRLSGGTQASLLKSFPGDSGVRSAIVMRLFFLKDILRLEVNSFSYP